MDKPAFGKDADNGINQLIASIENTKSLYPANIHHDEDVLKTSSRRLSSSSSENVFKTSSRRLDQDEYIRLSLKSSEDVFKTS